MNADGIDLPRRTARNMTSCFNTIGLIAKKNDDGVARTTAALIADLRARGKKVLVQQSLDTDGHAVTQRTRDELGADSDLVIVVGGDGTLLDAGRTLAAHDTPLLGINLGRLGFMVDVLPADMHVTLDAVFAGRYIAESRLMLGARIQRADGRVEPIEFAAINECVVRNQAFARVLDFDTFMDGDFISHHRADGMVVATPTGSTAYALSGGGPVLHPDLHALALVPICPHTLSDRPLIVHADHEIEVHVAASHEGAALFTTDGQTSQPLGPDDRVCIRRGPHALKLIHPPGYDYFNILRSKLQWGRGQRIPQS